ncbi:MAG: cobalamin-binding protein [Gammaproteobacteria bacterium]
MNFLHRWFLLTVVCLLTACDQQGAPVETETEGRVERIVTLAPHVTELVFALGAGERLVGAVEFSDYPAAAKSVPRIGDAFRIDYEQLQILQPDLVIGWRSGNPPEMIQRVRELGYPVLLVDAETLDDVVLQLEVIGREISVSSEAEQLTADIHRQIDELRDRPDSDEKLRVFWQITPYPLYTITGEHVLTEIISLCGGVNIFADIDGMAAPVSLESVLTRNPDIIIAAVHPVNDGWQQDWLEWSELNAVAEQQLYTVDSDLVSRPGPRLLQGAADVCSALESARP